MRAVPAWPRCSTPPPRRCALPPRCPIQPSPLQPPHPPPPSVPPPSRRAVPHAALSQARAKASQGPAAPAAAAEGGRITIDDFAKIELRVGVVKVAERVPKADKLLRLEVDIGTEVRQVLAGIAE